MAQAPERLPDCLVLGTMDPSDDLESEIRSIRASGTRLYASVDSQITGGALDSLVAQVRPDGIMLSGLARPSDLQKLDVMLSVAEVRCGGQEGETAIVLLIDNPHLLLQLHDLPGKSPRLSAIGWDGARLAESLRVKVGNPQAFSSGIFTTVRSLTLIAARASGVAALDFAPPGYTLDEIFERHGSISAADGFDGIFCSNPDPTLMA